VTVGVALGADGVRRLNEHAHGPSDLLVLKVISGDVQQMQILLDGQGDGPTWPAMAATGIDLRRRCIRAVPRPSF
jgi:hypothetical protein